MREQIVAQAVSSCHAGLQYAVRQTTKASAGSLDNSKHKTNLMYDRTICPDTIGASAPRTWSLLQTSLHDTTRSSMSCFRGLDQAKAPVSRRRERAGHRPVVAAHDSPRGMHWDGDLSWSVVLPAQGPGKVSGMGETESATGPPPSQAGLRAKLLQGATWALALTGWSYILTPRMTLSAYFGASGDPLSSSRLGTYTCMNVRTTFRGVVHRERLGKWNRCRALGRYRRSSTSQCVLHRSLKLATEPINSRAGDQADVLMWRAIGVGHLLLANITQNLEVRSHCTLINEQLSSHPSSGC